MGLFWRRIYPHPHPNPPLEGEGDFSAEDQHITDFDGTMCLLGMVFVQGINFVAAIRFSCLKSATT